MATLQVSYSYIIYVSISTRGKGFARVTQIHRPPLTCAVGGRGGGCMDRGRKALTDLET